MEKLSVGLSYSTDNFLYKRSRKKQDKILNNTKKIMKKHMNE